MTGRPQDETSDDDAFGVDDDDETTPDLDDIAGMRPEDIDVDGTRPLPEELTGRASGTDEDLVALFDNASDKHMTDGFRGGSEDEPPLDDDEIGDDAGATAA
ncbi:MAG: hypothetical protein V4813_18325 [Gemmatimonadota bacterium]